MLPTIAFVHLNSPIPLYLRFNIVSTIKKFPNAKVVIIRNDGKSEGIHSKLWHYDYKPGQKSNLIEDSLSHPKSFRNNFWFSAIQRFDALRSYMESSGEPILHIESDVIISKDFPIENFESNSIEIAYPVVAKNRGVASTVFIRNLETAEKLIDFSLEACLVDSQTTDMEILANFSVKNPEQVTSLAFGPNDPNAYNENFEISRVLSSFSIFNGIFDGNDIGYFLFGTDPRNKRGVSYLRTSIEGNYARIDKWNFKFENLRKFLSLEFHGDLKPIYSLHATSKKLGLFHHTTQNYVIRGYVRKQKRSGRKELFPLITIIMIYRKMIKSFKS